MIKRILNEIKEFFWPKDFARNMAKGKYYKQGMYKGQARKARGKR
jgi:hypothetical protein